MTSFLARITRMTLRSWRTKMRPAALHLFLVAEGVWQNRRLAKEAQRVEGFLSRQSWRGSQRQDEQETLLLAPDDDEFRVALLGACGSRASLSDGFANEPQKIKARRWVSDFGLPPEAVTSEIKAVLARSSGERVQSLRYFTPAMERLAGQMAESFSREI